MTAIDWSTIYCATNTDNKPTPGYIFNDIIYNVSHAAPAELPTLVDYLVDCVNGDHAHVKLKALFVIKTLAYRIPPFCECMQAQHRLIAVQEAASFSGPPSETYGDEPYRLVREAAESALCVLNSGEHYHTQYREMSQRIVGFGNYTPSADTLRPDGSIDIKREVSLSGAVDLFQSGILAFVGGMKGVLSTAVHSKAPLDGLEPDVDEFDDCMFGGEDDMNTSAYPSSDVEQQSDEKDQGSYMPPALPEPTSQPAAQVYDSAFDDFDRLWEDADPALVVAPTDDIDTIWQATDDAQVQELADLREAHDNRFYKADGVTEQSAFSFLRPAV